MSRALRRSRLALLIATGACSRPLVVQPVATSPASVVAPSTDTVVSLKRAFEGTFLIGAALNADQFYERDTLGAALVKTQFNTITPENVLKWELVHPRQGVYDFAASDRFVEFGERNRMFIVGHTLVWHSQTPRWVFQDSTGKPVSRDTLLARMRDHIHTVVGRYKGRIRGWDVVNEALNEDGSLRRSPWFTIIGEEYLLKAFQFAREADPDAELYYNDYSVENARKRNGAVALVSKLQAQGVRITGVGLQGHDRLDWPTAAQQDSTITAFAALGVKVMITELDIDVLPRAQGIQTADVSQSAGPRADLDPYRSGIPDSVLVRQAARYAELFEVFLRHRATVSRITFWGVADGDSWLNNWPVRGRTSYPLLFDRNAKPKPAFDAIIRLVRKGAVLEDSVSNAARIETAVALYNHKPSALRGYLFDTTEPLFPFGHGLSYTTFGYANLRLSSSTIKPDGRTIVSVDISNTLEVEERVGGGGGGGGGVRP